MAIGLGRPTLSSATWEGVGLSPFVLIFGQPDLLSSVLFFSQQDLWLKRLGSKFEMSRPELDQMLAWYSLAL